MRRPPSSPTRPLGRAELLLGLASVASLGVLGALTTRDVQRERQGKRSERGLADRTGFGSEPPSGARETASIQDRGRGRRADTPSAVPALGWKDILWRTYEEFSHDRLMLVSAGVTFYVLLALFPAITAMVSIYGLFTDASNFGDQMQALGSFLPTGAMDIISEQMGRVASKSDGKLGIGLVFGLGVALWSANAGMKTLFDALNIVYEEEEKRGFIKLTLVSLLFTLATLVFLILALAGVVLLPIVLEFIGLGALETWLLLLRWPILLAVVTVGLAIIYRLGPSRRPARWRWVSWGAVVAAVLWVVFSIAFSWYAQNFGSYDETYGSLGAAIGFMTWIWVSTMVVLLGAELNAELEHQTARDTTTEAERPMGQRGARMADTLGKTSG